MKAGRLSDDARFDSFASKSGRIAAIDATTTTGLVGQTISHAIQLNPIVSSSATPLAPARRWQAHLYTFASVKPMRSLITSRAPTCRTAREQRTHPQNREFQMVLSDQCIRMAWSVPPVVAIKLVGCPAGTLARSLRVMQAVPDYPCAPKARTTVEEGSTRGLSIALVADGRCSRATGCVGAPRRTPPSAVTIQQPVTRVKPAGLEGTSRKPTRGYPEKAAGTGEQSTMHPLRSAGSGHGIPDGDPGHQGSPGCGAGSRLQRRHGRRPAGSRTGPYEL